MSSTVDQLNETTNTEGLYVLGSQNNQSIKYNLGSAIDKIDECNDIIGGGSVQEYSPLKKYYPGQFVSYQDKIYKFIQIHPAGEWNPNEVDETNLFGELQGLVENVTITISGLDDLGNKTIVVYVEGEPNPRSLTTNSLGQVETSINKGLTYSVYPQSYGNYIVQNYLNIKASINERYINIPYQQSQVETCTVEVNVIVSGNGSIADFNGKEITILNQSNQQSLTTTIDNTGKATFTNITKYTTYTINSTGVIPSNNTYRKPANSTILTNFDINSINLEYMRIYQIGIFLVNGTTWEETEITQEFIDTLDSTMKSTYPYIHVCTEALVNAGCDYYVRCRDLTSERLATESAAKQWSTVSVTYPDVSTNTTNEYNGRKQTYYMIYDSVNLGISSPAAIFASSQSLEINGKIVNGYIGTAAQMSIIFIDTGNRNLITSALTNLGYSNIDYYKGWCWTSIQSLTFDHRDPNRPSWSWQGMGNSFRVIPFFSK